jgi:hypothetical protein
VPAKVPVYVIPDLTDCPVHLSPFAPFVSLSLPRPLTHVLPRQQQLKPYVSWSTKRVVVEPLRLPSEKELAQLE